MANSVPDQEDLSELLNTLSRARLANLLFKSLSRDQIAGILLSATNTVPSTRSNIHRAADAEKYHRTLLITGLGVDATVDSLCRCFSPFGKIEGVGIPFGENGQPKGYGFVLFRHLASTKKALRQQRKPIDGGQMTTIFCSHTRSARMIRVRNLPRDFSGFIRLFEFFKQFGEIEEAKWIFEEPQTIAYFLYETLEGAVRALEEPTKNFQGSVLICEKKAFRGTTVPAGPDFKGNILICEKEEFAGRTVPKRALAGGDQSGAVDEENE